MQRTAIRHTPAGVNMFLPSNIKYTAGRKKTVFLLGTTLSLNIKIKKQ
jgi:hypothetical protein